MASLRLVRVQRKRIQDREILYIHLPKEYVERSGVKPGDYIAWEIDGRGRLILKKLR